MYLIALCDDETAELNKLEEQLNLYQSHRDRCDFKIERFEKAAELLFRVSEGEYEPDLVLMDIYMPEKLGIDVAKELRGMGNECKIIFFTASKEHALEAFSVDAAQYLLKPVSQKKLFSVLDKLLQNMDEEQVKYVLFRTDGKIHRVALNEIIYCEAQKKCQRIYLADGSQLLLRMTMAKIYEMLSDHSEFIKVGIAYIVSLEHIESLNAQKIQLDNGKAIYLPRGSYKPLKEQYFQYYCGGG